MEKFFNLLQEAKTSEDETLMQFIFIAIVLFVADILHLFLHFNFPDSLRTIYFIIFLSCYYVLINRYYRNKRIKRETAEFLEKQKENHKTQIQNYSKIAFPLFDNLTNEQKTILFQFVKDQSLEITLNPNKSGKASLNEIVSINNILSNIGLKIEFIGIVPYLVINIDQIYYDLLVAYYDKATQK